MISKIKLIRIASELGLYETYSGIWTLSLGVNKYSPD